MTYQIGNLDVGVSFSGDVSGLQQATGSAGSAVDGFGSKTTGKLKEVQAESKRTEDSMARLANGIKGAFVGGSVAVGLIKLKNVMLETSTAIIDAQVQLDKWSNGFKFGAGSMAAGAREMAFVREEAQRLGLELAGSATQYMKLVAASRGTAMEGEKTRNVFTAIAEAATVMGMSGEQSERAFMAITQMMSKGKVQAEELRGQLGEHLPGAFAIAARAMGVTEVELNKLMETGQVMSADFLPKFGAQLRKELAGSVEDATKSMQASLNRYETAWLTFKQNVAQTGASDFIGGQINILSDALAGVSERMESARAAGGGFWSQTAAGAAGVAAFLNPINAFSYSAQALDGQLKQAQESLKTLQERAQASPGSPYFRVEIAQTRLLVQELERAIAAKAMLDMAPGPVGSVGSGDTALARAQRADYEKRMSAYRSLMTSLATPQEKFSEELAKQKALLGDLFTPEVEARLRAHYIKPVREAKERTEALSEARKRDIAVGELRNKQVEEAAKAEANYQSARQNQNFDDYFDAMERERQAIEDRIKAGRTTLEQIQFENTLLAMNTTEREVAVAMRELERQGVTKGTEAYLKYADAIRDGIITREATRQNIEFWDSIESTAKGVWTDVGREGVSAFERVGDTIQSAVLDMLWQVTAKKWLIDVGVSMGVPGAAQAAQQYSINAGVLALSTASNAASIYTAGSTLGSVLTTAGQGLSSFTTALTAGAQSLVGLSGTTAQMTASLQAAGYWTGSAASTAATTAGASAGSTLVNAVPYATVALVVANALGLFRKTTTVGSGLMGELGGEINSYDLRRKSGTLFSGPDYSIRDNGVASQNQALQDAFRAMRTGAIQVADAFDISAEGIEDFTVRIGNELINPDTGGYGLKLEGLNEQEIQAKVQAALATANDAIAAEILGIKTVTVDTIKRTVTEVGSTWDDGYTTITRDIEEQVTSTGLAVRRDLLPWMQRIADASGTTAATLQAIAAYPDQLLQLAGTSRDALVQAFGQGLMTGDAQAAGQTVANQLVASIEMSMIGVARDQVFDIVSRGIMTPMIDALVTGQNVIEALSQSSLDAVVAKATATAQALGAVLNDPTFAASMDAIRTNVGSALSTAGAAINYAPQYQLQATSVASMATATAGLASSATDYNNAASEREGLERQLLELQGNTAALRALERDALDPSNRALLDRVHALEDEQAAIEKANAVAAERAGLERQWLDLTGNTAAIRALELAALDPANRALQERIWALQDERTAIDAARTANERGMAALRAGLTGVIDLAASQTDGFMSALEKQAARDRKLLETNRAASASLVQDVRTVFDSLQSAVDRLFVSVDSTAQWQAAQGREYIASALSAARLTGAMPDAEDLNRAISAATSGLDAAQYGTQAEADYARLVLANELRDLQDISGDQLTEAERMLSVAESQLSTLDDQLTAYREQIDAMRGVQAFTGTTAELMARLVAAMEAERGIRAGAAGSTLLGRGQAIYSLGTQSGLSAAGQFFTKSDAFAAAAPLMDTGNAYDALALYSQAQQTGFSIEQLEKIYGQTPGTLEAEVAKIEQALGVTLPRFDVGANRILSDTVAVLHKDEAVLPPAFNPWAGGSLPGMGQGGGNAELLAEVRALRQQNERLEARLVAMEFNTRRSADGLERVTRNSALVIESAPTF